MPNRCTLELRALKGWITMNKNTMVLFGVIAIGGLAASPVKAWGHRESYETPRTMQLAEQWKAINAHQERLEAKRALINDEIDQDASTKDRISDEIKSIKRRLKEDTKREIAAQKRRAYDPGMVQLENTYNNGGARLAEQARTRSNADYGAYDGEYKRVAEQRSNSYLLSEREYQRNNVKPGIHYEGGY